MATNTTPASEVFHQIADLFASPAFVAALPVIIAAVRKLDSDPTQLSNPAFGAQFVADVTAVLPQIDAAAMQGAVATLSAIIAAALVKNPPAQAKATQPAEQGVIQLPTISGAVTQ